MTSVQDLAVVAALLHHPQHPHAVVVATDPFWTMACCHSGMEGGSHQSEGTCAKLEITCDNCYLPPK